MFRIDWATIARDRVAAAWDIATPADRERIMDAIDLVERLLSETPDQLGESREPGGRILVEPPLAVSYRLNVRQQRVFVYDARVFEKRT
jgi:hypothetical protein